MAKYSPRIGDRSPWLWETEEAGTPSPKPVPKPVPRPAPRNPAPKPLPPSDGPSPTRTLERGDEVTISLRAIPQPEDVVEEIDETGHVTLPYIKRIKIEGLTTGQAELAIEKAYVEGQFYPKIDVIVRPDADEYYVRGEVKREGRYFLTRDITLLMAIAAAGGYTDFASSKVRVYRGNRALKFNIRSIEKLDAPDPLIKPGDIIVVRRRWLWW